jgi:hypothetical protein
MLPNTNVERSAGREIATEEVVEFEVVLWALLAEAASAVPPRFFAAVEPCAGPTTFFAALTRAPPLVVVVVELAPLLVPTSAGADAVPRTPGAPGLACSAEVLAPDATSAAVGARARTIAASSSRLPHPAVMAPTATSATAAIQRETERRLGALLIVHRLDLRPTTGREPLDRRPKRCRIPT